MQGQEVLRCLLQRYLDCKASNEPSLSVITTDDESQLNHIKKQTSRKLTSQFGNVSITRKGYSQRKQGSRFPLDKSLNLSSDQYSDGKAQGYRRGAQRSF